MASYRIIPREQIVVILNDVHSAAALARATYDDAQRSVSSPRLAVVLKKSCDERRELIEDSIEALASMEAPPKQVERRAQMRRSTDLEILRRCVASDGILDDHLVRALSVPLPIHLQSVLESHRSLIAKGRAAAETWERVLSSAGNGGEPHRVLVVEEDRDLRGLICSALQNRGFVVEEASDGLQALDKLEAMRSDVILLDLMMPRLSGVGFLRKLSMLGVKPPPVVIYSAYIEPIAESFPNVTAVLRKTADLDTVLAAVRRSAEMHSAA